MIVKRFWFGKKKDALGHFKRYCGWFLFGIIPIYIKQQD